MRKIEKVIDSILFVFIFLLYAFSTSKTIHFWDSAEFVTSNYHLQATHPPGAPFYTLLSNFILLFFPSSWVVLISNLISAFFGALTVVLLFKITRLITSSLLHDEKRNVKLLPFLTGMIAALTLAFSTTFWTVSTETEVYTLSSFLLLSSFYILLLWHQSNCVLTSRRLMLLFAFVLGISLGVHLINLSVIIPLSILHIHKKKNLEWRWVILSLLSSTLMFLLLYSFCVLGFIKVAAALDVRMVNNFNLPVNSGVLLLVILLLVSIGYVLFKTKKIGNSSFYHVTLGVLFFAIGTSSYLMPFFRNNVSTPFSNQILTSNESLKYIKAKQFGVDNIPLVKGTIFNAPLDKTMPFLNGEQVMTYNSVSKKYEVIDDGKYSKINYANEFDMFFPRMFSQKPSSATGYTNWTDIKGKKVTYPVQGKATDLMKPTFSENIRFFINYQVKWMYLRYLYWNFIGKQNNNKGTGEIFNGNWISGINSIDASRIGDISLIPDSYKKDKSQNAYYFLPFILGLIGIWSLRKNRLYLITSIIFFLTFGMGIIIYLNPLPESILVRERDYIFLGSYVIFSFWIGLAILTLYDWLKKIPNNVLRIGIVFGLVFCFAPLQLFAKNWDDHQRNKDTFAYDLGKSYLDSCPENAILITNGDNFTFPLWYLQEVENYRADIRVINFDQLNLEFYIEKLKKRSLNSDPVFFTFSKENYIEGNPKLFPLQKETDQPADLKLVFDFLNNEKTKIKWNGKDQHYIPTDIFRINVNASKMNYNLFESNKLKATYISSINWKYSKDFYALNELILMDVIQNNISKRPICFAVNGKKEHYIGLQDFMIHEGFVEILYPMKRTMKNVNPKIVDVNKMYSLLIDESNFKKYNDENVINYENKEYVQLIVRRNFYFLAQALLENGENGKAEKVIDRCFELFPNQAIPFKQFAFALGKLYYRLGYKNKGDEMCLLSMNNLFQELQWLTSFNPDINPIINVKKGNALKKMYEQMIQQLGNYNPEKAIVKQQEFETFNKHFFIWEIKNWPYEK